MGVHARSPLFIGEGQGAKRSPKRHSEVPRSAQWTCLTTVTESDKRVEGGNGRVHDDWVILAVLSSEFEDPFEGVMEHLAARGSAVIR